MMIETIITRRMPNCRKIQWAHQKHRFTPSTDSHQSIHKNPERHENDNPPSLTDRHLCIRYLSLALSTNKTPEQHENDNPLSLTERRPCIRSLYFSLCKRSLSPYVSPHMCQTSPLCQHVSQHALTTLLWHMLPDFSDHMCQSTL